MSKRFFLSLAALLTTAVAVFAQSHYEPTTSWAYLNPDFQNGSVSTYDGTILRMADLNIYLADGKLHFIQDGTIMEAEMGRVYIAQIGNEFFINRAGRMNRILYQGANAVIYEQITIDYDKMNKSDIGYGISSATASTQATTLHQMGLDGGTFGNTLNKRLESAVATRGEGKALKLRKDMFILINGRDIPAGKREFLAVPGLDQADAKRFLKENKIKWKDLVSLTKVAEYLAEHLK